MQVKILLGFSEQWTGLVETIFSQGHAPFFGIGQEAKSSGKELMLKFREASKAFDNRRCVEIKIAVWGNQGSQELRG